VNAVVIREDHEDQSNDYRISYSITFLSCLGGVCRMAVLLKPHNTCVTVLPFARMRKREPKELVGLPGFAGRVNRRGFVDLTWQVFIYRSIHCLLTICGQRWFISSIYMQSFICRTDGLDTERFIMSYYIRQSFTRYMEGDDDRFTYGADRI